MMSHWFISFTAIWTPDNPLSITSSASVFWFGLLYNFVHTYCRVSLWSKMPILISTLLLPVIVLLSPAAADRMVLFTSTCRSSIDIGERVVIRRKKKLIFIHWSQSVASCYRTGKHKELDGKRSNVVWWNRLFTLASCEVFHQWNGHDIMWTRGKMCLNWKNDFFVFIRIENEKRV